MNGSRIDWDKIHQRLALVSQAIEKGLQPGEAEKKRILRERAARLAREAPKTAAGDAIEVVEFLLANEHYGIETEVIREIYPLKEFTPLPCVPPFVLGLVNVRGRIISIVDIRKFFNLPARGLGSLDTVIIVGDSRMEFGILAEAISGVRTIAVSEISAPLPTLTGIRQHFLKGVTSERLVILDAVKILADESIAIHEEV